MPRARASSPGVTWLLIGSNPQLLTSLSTPTAISLEPMIFFGFIGNQALWRETVAPGQSLQTSAPESIATGGGIPPLPGATGLRTERSSPLESFGWPDLPPSDPLPPYPSGRSRGMERRYISHRWAMTSMSVSR